MWTKRPVPFRYSSHWNRSVLVALVGLISLPALAAAQVTVTLNTDTGAPGELRSAVNIANTDGIPTVINFAPGLGVIQLNPLSGPLVIQGEDQTWVQGPGPTQLLIDANGASSAFEVRASGCAISGLSIANAGSYQIFLDGTLQPSMTNWIYDCHIGLDSLGNAFGSNNFGVGIIGREAMWNVVGTDGGSIPGTNGETAPSPPMPPFNIATGGLTDLAERCVISNNPAVGVFIHNNASGNRVAGNLIGTDPLGTTSIPNGDGVRLDNLVFQNYVGVSDDNSATINLLGGGEAFEGNVISGNDLNGVMLDLVFENTIAGNIIGPDITGTTTLSGPNPGNLQNGIRCSIQSVMNLFGTDGDSSADVIPGALTAGEQNILSNNGANGVLIEATSNMNTVAGNFIGTDITGALPLSNGTNGVEIDSADQNLVGTNSDLQGDTLEGNVIAANINHGIFIASDINAVCGNLIGIDALGGAMGNGASGVSISGGANNLIGFGPVAWAPQNNPALVQVNAIGNNANNGILLTGGTASGNQVVGNFIGETSASVPAPNAIHGILLQLGANANFIGFEPTVAMIPPNVIVNNVNDGVHIDGSTTIGNAIVANSITANGLLGIENINLGNTEEVSPLITFADYVTGTVSGTSGAEDNSVIHIYQDPAGQGAVYLGKATVIGGTWTVSGLSLPVGPINLTATVTDTTSNTSEFGTPVPFSRVLDWDLME